MAYLQYFVSNQIFKFQNKKKQHWNLSFTTIHCGKSDGYNSKWYSIKKLRNISSGKSKSKSKQKDMGESIE